LRSPIGICFNPNDECLYVCDTNKHEVRKITLQGRVSTFVKDLIYVSYIVVYHKDNSFYVLQLHKNTVTKINSKGETSVFAKIGKGGADAVYAYPSGLAIDQITGTLFISEFWSHTIHMISPQGEVVQLAGTKGESGFADGRREEAKFNWPGGVCFDDNRNSLLVCDGNNDRIRRISINGEVSTVCRIKDPLCVAATKSGTILVGTPTCIYKITTSISGAYEAVALTENEKEKKREGGKSTYSAAFSKVLGLAVHENSHSCFVSDSVGNTISKIAFTNE